jgi:hypothetical protein
MIKFFNKGFSSLIIVVLLALAALTAVGGVLAYQYLTVPSPERGEWSGTITLINAEEKIMEAQGINQTIRSSILPETIIEDKQGNPISLGGLKEGDFVSISGIYQMAGKMTPEWEVIIVAEKIKVLGECVKEGEERTSDIWCCPNLALLDQKYCTKCGDSICKSPENQENCPLDCTKISEPVSVSVFIDIKSFDLNNKTFGGMTQQIGGEKKNVKILTTDSTKFYRTSEPSWEKEYFTFSEFYSLFKNWNGPSWPFTVKGILEKEGEIRADEVFMIAQ